MFNKHDEEARKLMHDYFEKYDVKSKGKQIEPRVYFLQIIAKALKEAAKAGENKDG